MVDVYGRPVGGVYGQTVGGLLADAGSDIYGYGQGLLDYIRRRPESAGLIAGQFAPGAATADFYGRYPDPMNPSQMLPSAGQNIAQGNILDAAFQSAGLLGDAFYAAAPFTAGAAAIPGAALSAPRAAQLAKRNASAEKTFFSDLSKNKLRIPLEEMSRVTVPTGELLPRTIITPESLQGGILTPGVGDRTEAGAILRQINDVPLAYEVPLEGGPGFMQSAAQKADGSTWASDKGVITRLTKLARNLSAEGDDVNFVYSSMGARSGDFSTMMSDAILAQIPNLKITKKSKKEFDSDIRKIFPEWVGVDSPEARSQLIGNANLRKAFAETTALGKYQDQNFPDIASTRFAITEQDLIEQPTGVSGYAISRLDPTGRVIESPQVPHTTYNTQMAGEYIGGFEDAIPREIMFPDFYKQRRVAGAPEKADDRAFSMSNVSQNADQEWLDGVMAYIERLRR